MLICATTSEFPVQHKDIHYKKRHQDSTEIATERSVLKGLYLHVFLSESNGAISKDGCFSQNQKVKLSVKFDTLKMFLR